MEHGQEGQHAVRADEVVQGDAVDCVPVQRVLGQHGALGPPGRARRVDDQRRIIERARLNGGAIRKATLVTAPRIAREAEADQPDRRQIGANSVDARARGFIAEQRRDIGVPQDIELLGQRRASSAARRSRRSARTRRRPPETPAGYRTGSRRGRRAARPAPAQNRFQRRRPAACALRQLLRLLRSPRRRAAQPGAFVALNSFQRRAGPPQALDAPRNRLPGCQ